MNLDPRIEDLFRRLEALEERVSTLEIEVIFVEKLQRSGLKPEDVPRILKHLQKVN